MFAPITRRMLRTKVRRTRHDETVLTKPSLAKRGEDRSRREGRLKKQHRNTPPLPAAVRSREWAKKTPEQRDKQLKGVARRSTEVS